MVAVTVPPVIPARNIPNPTDAKPPPRQRNCPSVIFWQPWLGKPKFSGHDPPYPYPDTPFFKYFVYGAVEVGEASSGKFHKSSYPDWSSKSPLLVAGKNLGSILVGLSATPPLMAHLRRRADR
ncbi:hypothetical protein CIHG_07206 [Coccidioides immitis H538.4]|uniref:Uncharacterized protein n=1 Tax=Coccidioides immitis H538.4 TaxID=396776 RepID=A0A0J8RW66_COCIT|nr:hypothetical protein CIHG_07206 [Coccidioides immitis H538.4]